MLYKLQETYKINEPRICEMWYIQIYYIMESFIGYLSDSWSSHAGVTKQKNLLWNVLYLIYFYFTIL